MITSNSLKGFKDDFPLLNQPSKKPLVYLDSGATTQKPACVINALQHYYEMQNANVHRGVYRLSANATFAYEKVRDQVRDFIGAKESKEIIFVKGTTEAINLVAHSFGAIGFTKGDEILISTMEHHSNIVPWQLLADKIGLIIKVIPITDTGEIQLDVFEKLLNSRTKLVAITHVSNVLGTVNPIQQITALAHNLGAKVLVDGAQAAAHLPINVQALDCDFYTFSSHKTYGPMGVGVLYGKKELLELMPPYQGGGDMIATVSFENTTFNGLPHKFEAGTPDVGGVIAFGTALNYIKQIGFSQIRLHEQTLLMESTKLLSKIPNLTIIGSAAQKIGVISFVIDKIHPHDLGTVLDDANIAVRAGHHCAMPLMERFQVPATTRISFGIYNTVEDIHRLKEGLEMALRIFHV